MVAAAYVTGEPVDGFIADACRYYLEELSSGRPALRAPRLPKPDRRARDVVIALPEAAWRSLRAIAAEQGVALARLLEHAALLYASDYLAGRVAERVVRGTEAGDGASSARE